MDFTYLDALIDEDFQETAVGGYRHVWAVVETTKSDIVPASLATVGQGRDIADQFGVYLFAVLLGHELKENLVGSLAAYGADSVLLVDDPVLAHYQVETWATALAQLIRERQPEIVLMAATPLGNDLAPRLAQRLETGLISHCVQLGLDMAERQLLGAVARMQGDLFHTLACPRARPQLATLEPAAFRLPYADSSRSAKLEQVNVMLDGANGRLTWLEMDTAVVRSERSLTDSRVIVAAGRGVCDAAGFALVERLADALGGQVAGSRGALDAGWIDIDRQVGMTGQSVKPDLYIACGISGAIQHLVGIQEARFVIAINRDENAPIMQVANAAAVGDVKAVISELLEML